ncbi:tRNA (adenine(58)-N(1))-methyltransferase, mitochondrial-like [Anneissia japonica]|uniref:tRNA (adenine(58)-N(1))-methyltransferase, mitochondrial-like n=1 Tax=Anneissia japonica TaxID=1529436 RepID=UPI0014255A27|nr:tRNA (adenine(58)-N(1))-methyltransferase, mitochondrial-like [Anneissia japonica]
MIRNRARQSFEALIRILQPCGVSRFWSATPASSRYLLFRKKLFQRLSNELKAQTVCEAAREINQSAMENCSLFGKVESSEGIPQVDSKVQTKATGNFIDGELAMIIRENIKKHTSMKVIVKLTEKGIFSCKYGAIPHRHIIGETCGREFLTSQDIQVLIRRPTLHDYILIMRRLPTISFPKDICTMLMMIDVSPGDSILEAGSGSGAMTLFLSKAVGPQGKVHSMEMKMKHLDLASKNFNRWKDSWNLSHNCKWTSNVEFHHGCLINNGYRILEGLKFDGAVIDMEECAAAMPVLIQFLKIGGAVCFYVANITQVIEICDIIRSQELPFTVENIVEVQHTDWIVNPARRRNGAFINSTSNMSVHLTDDDGKEAKTPERLIGPAQYIKYIAKPWKGSEHSAFLVKAVRLELFPSSYKV